LEHKPYPTVIPEHRLILLDVADQSLRYRLNHAHALLVQPQEYPPPLQELRASFVTLHAQSQLRGCIGSLEPRWPLVKDVAENACAAGFSDPRFPPLQAQELRQLDIHVSVLGNPEPILAASEQALLDQLRPNIDGLILKKGEKRGTFLPSVWESLPDPESFLRKLKVKAGLPQDYWSPSLEVFRYTAESFSRSSIS